MNPGTALETDGFHIAGFNEARPLASFLPGIAGSHGKPLWAFATRGQVDSSPVVCGDKVVVGSDDGRVYVVSLDQGKELWSYEIGRAVSASPALTDGKIVIGSEDGSVYCFGAKAKVGSKP